MLSSHLQFGQVLLLSFVRGWETMLTTEEILIYVSFICSGVLMFLIY